MKEIGLIFPDDLSTNNSVLSTIKSTDLLVIYEPCDTFYQINHHKHKLVLLISALRHWKKELESKFTSISDDSFAIGDWNISPRVESAYISGTALAKYLIEARL